MKIFKDRILCNYEKNINIEYEHVTENKCNPLDWWKSSL